MDNKSILKNIEINLIQVYAFNKGMESRNNFRYKKIYDAIIYILSTQQDLIIASTYLYKNTNESERNFFARIITLTLFEYFQDIHNIIGNKLFNELNENNFSHYIVELKAIGKEINNLKKSNKNFKYIRNNTIGHKTQNKTELLELVYNIDDKKVIDVSVDTINVNTKLIRLFNKIQNEISEYHKKMVN